MTSALRPDLWAATLPAAQAARIRGLEHVNDGGYFSREEVTPFRTNREGWSTTTAADRLLSSRDAPIDWDRMFGPKAGPFASLAVEEVPELAAAVEFVCDLALVDPHVEQGISILSSAEQELEPRRAQIAFEYVRFVTDIIGRAEALGLTAEDDLRDIYLLLERARFAPELIGDLVVPIALTALDLDGPLKVAEGVWIEKLTEDMQCARATSVIYPGRVSAFVVAAATHAVVERRIRIDNRDRVARRYRTQIEMSRIDRTFQCLHIATGRDTGYAQAVVAPEGWADRWQHDLPPVWKVGEYRNFPDEFEDGGWNRSQDVVPQDQVQLLPKMFAALEAAPRNVQLAARRAVRASLRTDDEDRTLDATIGIEALVLSDGDRSEMTHRMAQRAAAALAADGFRPALVFKLVKKVYEHRSAIVHGRSRKLEEIAVDGVRAPAQDIGVWLLRSLLESWLLSDEPWTPKSLDDQILRSLATIHERGAESP